MVQESNIKRELSSGLHLCVTHSYLGLSQASLKPRSVSAAPVLLWAVLSMRRLDHLISRESPHLTYGHVR